MPHCCGPLVVRAMKRSVSRLDKASKVIAWCCVLLTAAFTATAIEWRVFAGTDNWWAALAAFVTTALIGAAPYAIYLVFVPASKASPTLRMIVLCFLVALSVVPNVWWAVTGVRTGGWNFFIVPTIQVFYLLVIVPFVIVLMHALRRIWQRAHDA